MKTGLISAIMCLMMIGGAFGQQQIRVALIPVPANRQDRPSFKISPPLPTIMRPAKTLRAGKSTTTAVPPFGRYGVVRCDEDGNLYYHVNTGAFRDSMILKVIGGGERSVLNKLSSDLAANTAFMDFAVTPEGKLSVLVEALQGKNAVNEVVQFSDDGNVASVTKLETPSGVVAKKFTVLENGGLISSGYYGSQAEVSKRGEAYGALFDASGRMIQPIKISGKADLSSLGAKLADGDATVGLDGNAYLLVKDQILVLSQSGELRRSLEFTRPEEALTAVKVAVNGGLVAITFVKKEEKTDLLNNSYLVLDGTTGDVYGYYRDGSGPEFEGEDVCFTRRDGFTFQSVKNGRIVLTTAPI